MQFFITIFKNLLGYDGLILLLALGNGFYCLPKLKHTTALLEHGLKPTIYVPIQQIILMIHPSNKSELDLHKLRKLKESETKQYHRFASITNMFPLMGILGTIISLLRLASLSNDSIMFNFTTALTSTFWGLVCAIVFKAIDGTIYPKIALNDDSFNLLINRIDQYTSKGDADEAKNIS
ncbi:MotA/TolQ/ExbB proton channel family protein [Vallitalea pronyensis]|uniref:MotA/TolQ/ExbB proton channel family protein n=1 Tax=Vallitalea pronyensis TaxID=1348613 RepID=A0A8J8SFT2_9FIRM|nr:MotA/TolQ/ExbB proton channel family protein [Vallitalea pronyensis]QUI21926.1 MotA/TolQ/ExbB proton channel family protein [Vallitalea pronyensis]